MASALRQCVCGRACTISNTADSLILVVEDDMDLRDVLHSALSNEGYSVAEAANGAEALQRLREVGSYALILLDLVMPVMDGWQFMAKQAADPLIASIPVVVMSSVARRSDMTFLGAAGHLEKPIPLSLLLETVRRCIESRNAGTPR